MWSCMVLVERVWSVIALGLASDRLTALKVIKVCNCTELTWSVFFSSSSSAHSAAGTLNTCSWYPVSAAAEYNAV